MSDGDTPYRIDVMIPMRDKHGLTRNLCQQLHAAGGYDRLWVYDNGSVNRNALRWLRAVEADGRMGIDIVRWGPERGIYRMWNDAWRRSLEVWRSDRTPRYLAILNNDLEVPAGFLAALGDALYASADHVWITYPQWQLGWPVEPAVTGELVETGGTRNVNGMSGYAFLLDVSRHDTNGLPMIDERFVWYSGDGDLVTKVKLAGGTAARVEGLPVGHIEKATSVDNDWCFKQGRADMRLFREIYHGDRH